MVKQINTWQEDFSSIAEYLSLPENLLRGFTATEALDGNIRFELHDATIAYWLTALVHHQLSLERVQPSSSFSPDPHRLFAIQHAHARCCSLLRHGQQEEVSSLSTDFFNEPDRQGEGFINPPAIPWLDPHDLLYLTHPTERQLIVQLLTVLDFAAETPSAPTKQYFVLAEKVSAAFQEVHRSCQLFGAFLKSSGDRFQAHMGLILATQRVLWQLLQSLTLIAPFDL
ncbi:MAG: DALR anticodon-binding domain-containing protein [Leptolyngbyaceae cyanobacterium bins.302]|nr:DALR anticodon-binding domain-containing protein [Leptolyngbyaceae cyanobacterium bins.302]